MTFTTPKTFSTNWTISASSLSSRSSLVLLVRTGPPLEASLFCRMPYSPTHPHQRRLHQSSFWVLRHPLKISLPTSDDYPTRSSPQWTYFGGLRCSFYSGQLAEIQNRLGKTKYVDYSDSGQIHVVIEWYAGVVERSAQALKVLWHSSAFPRCPGLHCRDQNSCQTRSHVAEFCVHSSNSNWHKESRVWIEWLFGELLKGFVIEGIWYFRIADLRCVMFSKLYVKTSNTIVYFRTTKQEKKSLYWINYAWKWISLRHCYFVLYVK